LELLGQLEAMLEKEILELLDQKAPQEQLEYKAQLVLQEATDL
jgi:hypothetical protein